MTDDEKRAYAKGYAAGCKRADGQNAKAIRQQAQNAFWQQVFCAALQASMISGTWQTAGKKWVSQDDHVRGCGRIADEAVEQHGWRV